MTDTRDTKPEAWTEALSTDLFYAARGLAEHELASSNNGIVRHMADVRLGVAAGVSSALQVLRLAGWIREEPSVDYTDTMVKGWAEQARRVLEPWDENPGDSDAAGVAPGALPPALAAVLGSVLAAQQGGREEHGTLGVDIG